MIVNKTVKINGKWCIVTEGWHKIKGWWTHIYQVFDGKNTIMYTDGVLEND